MHSIVARRLLAWLVFAQAFCCSAPRRTHQSKNSSPLLVRQHILESIMTPRTPKLLALVFAVLFVGCTTTSIEGIKSIAIPRNLSPRDAKIALARAVSGEAAGDGWKNWEKMTNAALGAAFGVRYAGQYAPRGQWYIESVEDRAVVFGCTRGGYYLRVRMSVGADTITPTIEDSQGLKQSGERIHKTAIEWVNRLGILVRGSLGQFSAYRASITDTQESENK